jgi:hypothetical protein
MLPHRIDRLLQALAFDPPHLDGSITEDILGAFPLSVTIAQSGPKSFRTGQKQNFSN